MPLAGRMRLSDFVLLGAVFVAVPIGLTAGLSVWRATTMTPLEEVVPVRTIKPPAEATPQVVPVAPEREVDVLLLEKLGANLGTDKVKDLAPDRPFKVNLYQDEGSSLPNRAKIDLDRDDLWDEKWTLSDGILRQVAPNDDEDYTLEYLWDGERWLDKGALATNVVATPPPPSPISHGDIIADTVMAWMGQDLGAPKLKDTTKGHPFKVNVYQDDGQSVVNRAKVDLDRDDKWDEKWTFDGGRVTREVSPSDDESYTQVTVWTAAGGWITE